MTDHGSRKKHSSSLSSKTTNPFQPNNKTHASLSAANLDAAPKSKDGQKSTELGKRKSINRRPSSISSSPNPSPPKIARPTIKDDKTPELVQDSRDTISPDSMDPETPSPCSHRRALAPSSNAVSTKKCDADNNISSAPFGQLTLREAVAAGNNLALEEQKKYQVTMIDPTTVVTTPPRRASSKKPSPNSQTPNRNSLTSNLPDDASPKITPSKGPTTNPRVRNRMIQKIREENKLKTDQRKRVAETGFWGSRVPDRPALQREATAKADHAKDMEDLKKKLRDKNDERTLLKKSKEKEMARLTESLQKVKIEYDDKLSQNLKDKKALEAAMGHLKAWPAHAYTNSKFQRLP